MNEQSGGLEGLEGWNTVEGVKGSGDDSTEGDWEESFEASSVEQR